MRGFIGERAKRRRRNFILFFVIMFFIIIIYYFYLPFLKLSDAKPAEHLLPSEKEIISPNIGFSIEELELKIFDKEQKILFRNKQLKKLKDEIRIMSSENKKLLESSISLENITNSSSKKEKIIQKIKKEQLIQSKIFKDSILQLKTKNQELLQKIKQNKNDSSSLNDDIKAIVNENLKLKNLNQNNHKKIKELEDFIEEKNLKIQLLKDHFPNGG